MRKKIAIRSGQMKSDDEDDSPSYAVDSESSDYVESEQADAVKASVENARRRETRRGSCPPMNLRLAIQASQASQKWKAIRPTIGAGRFADESWLQ